MKENSDNLDNVIKTMILDSIDKLGDKKSAQMLTLFLIYYPKR